MQMQICNYLYVYLQPNSTGVEISGPGEKQILQFLILILNVKMIELFVDWKESYYFGF